MANRTLHFVSSARSTIAGSKLCESWLIPITLLTLSRLEIMFSLTSGHCTHTHSTWLGYTHTHSTWLGYTHTHSTWLGYTHTHTSGGVAYVILELHKEQRQEVLNCTVITESVKQAHLIESTHLSLPSSGESPMMTEARALLTCWLASVASV